eukprot:TCONS_00017377-protein
MKMRSDITNLKLQYMLNMKRNPQRLADKNYQNGYRQRRENDNVIVMGGKDSYLSPSSTVSKFDIKSNTWKPCKLLNHARSSASAAYLQDHIYLTGGICENQDGRGSTHTRSVSCFTNKSDKWFNISPMSQQRSSHVTITHGNKVYAIGGYDGQMSLKSAECYDPYTDTWTEIESMNYHRSSFAAVTMDQYIYVLGGHNTCTVERYDTCNACWELMPAMSTKRLNFGAAQVCGFIYVVGGHDGREYLRSMERFDPVSSEWSVVCPMPSVRSGIGVTAAQHEIFVFGGHNGSRYLSSAYKYDVFQDKWTSIPDMTTARCDMAVISMDSPEN